VRIPSDTPRNEAHGRVDPLDSTQLLATQAADHPRPVGSGNVYALDKRPLMSGTGFGWAATHTREPQLALFTQSSPST